MKIIFRILDRNFQRAEQAELTLWKLIRDHRINGTVFQVHELPEFTRIGLQALPALEMNGVVIVEGEELTFDLLSDTCVRLARALRTIAVTRKD